MRKSGFTLIELLIVIIIISVLASLTLPQYQKMVRKAQEAEAKEVVRAISDAVWRYYLETGDFPGPAGTSFVAVPASLDVKAPPSKYWTYQYAHDGANWHGDGLTDYGIVVAWRGDAGPTGVTEIQISYRTVASSLGGTGQKMNDTYYRYYIHWRNGDTSWHAYWP